MDISLKNRVQLLKKRSSVHCQELSELFFRRCRLAYFVIKENVYTQQQLMDVAFKHYTGQVNKFYHYGKLLRSIWFWLSHFTYPLRALLRSITSTTVLIRIFDVSWLSGFETDVRVGVRPWCVGKSIWFDNRPEGRCKRLLLRTLPGWLNG